MPGKWFRPSIRPDEPPPSHVPWSPAATTSAPMHFPYIYPVTPTPPSSPETLQRPPLFRSSSSYEESLSYLVFEGYPRRVAAAALEMHANDLPVALAYLDQCEHQRHVRPVPHCALCTRRRRLDTAERVAVAPTPAKRCPSPRVVVVPHIVVTSDVHEGLSERVVNLARIR